MKDNNYQPSSAFTLVEVLVAVAVGGLLITLVAFTFTNLIRVRQRIIAATDLQKISDQLLLSITQEARWTKAVLNYSANELYFQTDIQCVRYTLVGTDLEKYTANLDSNGTDCTKNSDITDETTEQLNPPSMKVTDFQITNRSDNLDRPSFEIQLTLHSPPFNLTSISHTVVTPRNKFPGGQ